MRQITVNRLLQLERKLSRNPVLYNNYRKFMSEYESLGLMTEVYLSRDYYIPHHAVYKTDGDDIKLRVVFDASARCQSTPNFTFQKVTFVNVDCSLLASKRLSSSISTTHCITPPTFLDHRRPQCYFRTIKSYITCVKLDAVNLQPRIADFKILRSLLMKETQLRISRVIKVYIALFVCMRTKAIHLEAVIDLSTDAFLAALERLVARRGTPTSIHSDCRINFVEAARKLKAFINSPANRDNVSSQLMFNWNFNPPSPPHFGGLWEAGVKSTKSLMFRTMVAQTWTLKEFSTVLCRIEAALNSRPLTTVTSDPEDLDCLTPGRFFIDQPLMLMPEEALCDKPMSLQRD